MWRLGLLRLPATLPTTLRKSGGTKAVSGLLWPRATVELRSAWTAERGRPYASGYSSSETALDSSRPRRGGPGPPPKNPRARGPTFARPTNPLQPTHLSLLPGPDLFPPLPLGEEILTKKH